MALSHCERAELLNERSEFSNSGHGKPSDTYVPLPLISEVFAITPFDKRVAGGNF